MNRVNRSDLSIYAASRVTVDETKYALARSRIDGRKYLCIEGNNDGFEGNLEDGVLIGSLTPANASHLRKRLEWLNPVPLGLQRSAGCGDRLGLATPGHIRALREAPGVAPILAQQSIRENIRTGRTPQQVIDDAMWGVFQEGWRKGYGADADHLKTIDDADVTASCGYTFFTIDPGDHVDDDAYLVQPRELISKVEALPWDLLESSPADLRTFYLCNRYNLENGALFFTEETFLKAAAKYGRAVAHTVRMYRHLKAILKDRPWELEVSVDETALPTTHVEHVFIASELKRLGIRWISLAPRYIGSFEKGVDYIGDLDRFRADFSVHAAIARYFGPYKLSLHSGSDKFSIYPIAMELTDGQIHLKTAGTSYLEALRAIARVQPDLFRNIYALAFARYDEDRLSYHVSAEAARAPEPSSISDASLPDVLDQFDAREMLHVTFGSALTQYDKEIKSVLSTHEDAHYIAVAKHFERHLAPFITTR